MVGEHEIASSGVVWDLRDFVFRRPDDLTGWPVARSALAPTLIEVKGVLQNRFGHEWAVFLMVGMLWEVYDT